MPPQVAKKTRPPNSAEDPRLYAALSLCCFLVGVTILILMVWKAETLAAFGLTGRLFYVMLIPMGLAAAGFLFGVLQSVAIYRRQAFGGTLVMGGPILAAALVVWGGFTLPPPEPGAFATVVYVHGPGGPQDMILRGRGKVVMDLRGNRRLEAIDEKGAAHFPGIPAEFRGQEIPISLEAEGFERADRGSRKLAGDSLYLAVRRSAGRLVGVVKDEQGEPVVGAAVEVEKFAGKTDAAGWFNVTIPGDRMRPEMTLDVRAPGFQPQTHSVRPGANEIRIRLVRRSK